MTTYRLTRCELDGIATVNAVLALKGCDWEETSRALEQATEAERDFDSDEEVCWGVDSATGLRNAGWIARPGEHSTRLDWSLLNGPGERVARFEVMVPAADADRLHRFVERLAALHTVTDEG